MQVQTLLAAVEQVRADTTHERIRTRGAIVRGAVRARGSSARGPLEPVVAMRPGDVSREITANPDLLAAYRDLKIALADPEIRETVLAALRAFARGSRARTDTDGER